MALTASALASFQAVATPPAQRQRLPGASWSLAPARFRPHGSVASRPGLSPAGSRPEWLRLRCTFRVWTGFNELGLLAMVYAEGGCYCGKVKFKVALLEFWAGDCH